jgi:hypothetical protein
MQDPEALPSYPRCDIRVGAGPLTRAVERRLAPRYGWNLEVLQGQEPVFPGSRIGGEYRVLNPVMYFLRRGARRPAAIDSLRIAEWLRFGNSVRQLTHLFALAERWGVRRLCLPSEHLLYRGRPADGFAITYGAGRRAFDLELSGYFLHPRALMSPLDAATEHRVLEDYVRPLLSPDLLRPDPRVGEDDLVMHFRGGDAFDTVDTRRGYWQPPLAYYLAACERERATRVWLVFEDRRNPTITAAERALRSRGIDVQIQSGSLIDDLRVLLTARRLVASIGTFLPAIAMLSTRTTAFYHFSPNPYRALASKGIRLLDAIDTGGDFMASVAADWGARPEQLAMMVSYPLSSIQIGSEG